MVSHNMPKDKGKETEKINTKATYFPQKMRAKLRSLILKYSA